MSTPVELTALQQRLFDRYTRHQPLTIEREPDAQTVWLDVGNQSFRFDYNAESVEQAIWYRQMLAKALSVIEHD